MEEPKEDTALAVKPPAVLEQIVRTDGQRKTIARNTANGKFMRRNEATAMKLTRDAQEFAEAKSEQDATLTNAQALRKHLMEVALKCTSEKSLIGLAKIYETLIQDATGAKAILDAAIKDANTDKLHPVQVVIITPPALMHPEIIEEKPALPQKTKPSFIEAEIVQQNAPKGADKIKS